jgi:hypothetical protein
VRELVLGALSASDKRLLLEGGTPRHELSGSSGPLRPEVTLRLWEIFVRQYTPAAWRSHLAWHSYWDQLGARAGDELVDLYPGSGAIGEAWRRYAGVEGRHVAGVDAPAARTSRPASTADVGDRSDASSVGRPRSARPYDLAAVCSEQASCVR